MLEIFNNASVEECAEKCYTSATCTTFQFNNTESECGFYGISKHQQSDATELDIDLYHLREHTSQCCPISLMNGAGLSEDERFSERFLSFETCVSTCYSDSWCKTVSFNRSNNTCAMSNYTSYNASVRLINDNWQYMEFTKYLPLVIHQDSGGLPNIINCHSDYFPMYNLRDTMTNRSFRHEFMAVHEAKITKGRMSNMFSDSVEQCAEKCYKSKDCRSFVHMIWKSECGLYRCNTREEILRTRSNHVFYQRRVQPNKKCCPVSVIHGVSLPKPKMFSERVLSFIDCLSICYNDSWCNTVNYNIRSQACLTTNYTSFNASVLISVSDWKYVEFVKCKWIFIFAVQLWVLFRLPQIWLGDLPFKTYEIKDGHLGVVNCHPGNFPLYNNEKCAVSVIHGAVLPESTIRSERIVSFIDCLSTCHNDPWCKTVNYNTKSKTCLMTDYTSNNATVSATQDDWIFAEFKQNYTFETYRDADNAVILKNCYSDKFRKLYFKTEKAITSAIQSDRFTRSLNSYTFSKTYKRVNASSRLACAARCNIASRCLAFLYENKRNGCHIFRLY
ncbi:uncharacterized protein LOC118766780 [Octopus sinensis]|uniref:Uncharacterized protein LOC118766780 n=1 Tax=Octopus sinensis TaxID=2607531 RepID=A0A7E6FHP2_9MOLL|nr:uncharacterized protein LOC118766780 [Octopus sinensis]